MPPMRWINSGLRSALPRLLQINQPIPPRSDEEMAAEVERHYRWNFTVNLIEGASFFFGAGFALNWQT